MNETIALIKEEQKSFNKSVKSTKNKIKDGKIKIFDKTVKQFRDSIEGFVYLSNIPHGFYEKELKGYFGQFGQVNKVRLARSKKTGLSKGFAFIQFKEEEVAKIAAETMNNYLMGKRLLKAKFLPADDKTNDIFNKPNFSKDHYPTKINRLRYKKKFNSTITKEEQDKKAKHCLQHVINVQKKLNALGIQYDFKPIGIQEIKKEPHINSLSLEVLKNENPENSNVGEKKKRKNDVELNGIKQGEQSIEVIDNNKNTKKEKTDKNRNGIKKKRNNLEINENSENVTKEKKKHKPNQTEINKIKNETKSEKKKEKLQENYNSKIEQNATHLDHNIKEEKHKTDENNKKQIIKKEKDNKIHEKKKKNPNNLDNNIVENKENDIKIHKKKYENPQSFQNIINESKENELVNKKDKTENKEQKQNNNNENLQNLLYEKTNLPKNVKKEKKKIKAKNSDTTSNNKIVGITKKSKKSHKISGKKVELIKKQIKANDQVISWKKITNKKKQ